MSLSFALVGAITGFGALLGCWFSARCRCGHLLLALLLMSVFAVSGLDSCAGEESGNSWWASCRNAGFAGNLSTTFRNPSLKLDSSEVDAY